MIQQRYLSRWLIGILAIVAVVGLWRSVTAGSPPDVATVAAELRCPACNGETVADSGSPVAASMRASIAEQLAQGRSADEIRQWFVERYGPEVLADGGIDGTRVLLWILPALALVIAGLLAVRTARRTFSPAAQESHRRGGGRWVWDAVAVGLVAMIATVALVGLRMPDRSTASPTADPAADVQAARTMGKDGNYSAAVDLYREALAQHSDAATRLELAYALLRTGRPDEAEDEARTVLATDADRADAVLVLGLAQRAEGLPEATSTLRRFLQLAPSHPAAPEIRRLIR